MKSDAKNGMPSPSPKSPALQKKIDGYYRTMGEKGGSSKIIHAQLARHSKARAADTDPKADSESPAGEPFKASYGGLALIAPYFPVLFGNLDLIKDDSIEKSGKAGEAVMLLHYLATGEQTSASPDARYLSVLLGLDNTFALSQVSLNSEFFREADRLLTSVMANWPVSKTLGIAGIRDGFFKRPADVWDHAANFELKLASHPLDVILRSLPWSISACFHPWMKKPLMVDWLS